MDVQQLQDFLQGFQDELSDLTNNRNIIELANDLHAQTVEQQVASCEVEYQNNLPVVLPTVAPISLLKIFTADDISETWQDWLDNFALAARACNWDEQKKLRVLPAYLDGTAHEVYSTLDQAIQNNWNNLTAALAQQLQQPDSAQSAINVLLTMRQYLDEPVSKFAAKIMKLVRKAYLAPAFTDAQ
ncbi:MAG: hypothetical protein GY861_01675 [bacterium]|nr:hypothetical protein [bacterium]